MDTKHRILEATLSLLAQKDYANVYDMYLHMCFWVENFHMI